MNSLLELSVVNTSPIIL